MSLTMSAAGPENEHARSRWLWLLLGGLAMGQLFAFWLLCNHQVRKAEARQNEVAIQQMALADCLQYIPGSTIASCNSRMGLDVLRAQQGGDATLTGAVPVSFSYR